MTNRINGYKPAEPIAPVKGVASSAAQGVDKSVNKSVGEATSAAPVADQVTFTGSARTLQKLSAAVASAPVVNAQKVAVVKQAVQNGTYQADAGAIADKLLQFENGLK